MPYDKQTYTDLFYTNRHQEMLNNMYEESQKNYPVLPRVVGAHDELPLDLLNGIVELPFKPVAVWLEIYEDARPQQWFVADSWSKVPHCNAEMTVRAFNVEYDGGIR